MTQPRSFNGWLVLDEYPTATFTAPGGKTVYCNSREVAVVMEYWARRWHAEVEPIAASHSDNWFKPRERRGTTKAGKWDAIGIHSWRPPGTKVGTGDQSNHRSATAIDINGHLHPYEATLPSAVTYRDGFTQAQRDKVREICHAPRDDGGRIIGRSGLDFARGRRDGMHLEIGPGVTRVQVQQAAKRLEDEVGRSSTADVMFRNAYGHDVRTLQNDLAAKGFKITAADAKFGPETETAVRAFQKAAGLTVDGRVGPATRVALRGWTPPTPPAPQPTPEPEPEPEPEPVKEVPNMDQYRTSGPTRYHTSAEMARFNPQNRVWLAGSEIDAALAASSQSGTVLLVKDRVDDLPEAVVEALLELKPDDVRAAGGRVTDAALYAARTLVGLPTAPKEA